MKRPLAIASAILGAVWIIATGVLLFYIANLVPIQALLLAFVAMDGAFLVLLALLLVTNTRRPWSERDPYAETTSDLLRNTVMLPDGKVYGRRAIDDRNVVERLSDILEEEASLRKPGETPAWVLGINQRHDAAASAFGDPPSEDNPDA